VTSKKPSVILEDSITLAYAAGLTTSEIMTKFHITYETAYNIRRAMLGIKRKRGRPKSETKGTAA
jgi:hypothetical protein